MKHEMARIEECSFFNSEYAYSQGYSRLYCTCGWGTIPLRSDDARVASWKLHVERNPDADERYNPRSPPWVWHCIIQNNEFRPCHPLYAANLSLDNDDGYYLINGGNVRFCQYCGVPMPYPSIPIGKQRDPVP